MSKLAEELNGRETEWEPSKKLVQQQLVKLQDAFAHFQLPPPPDRVERNAHRIAVLSREVDHTAVILAGMGFSNKAIAARTGLSVAQVQLRCKRVRVSRRAYRDGESPFAIAVIERASYFVAEIMAHHVRQLETHKMPNYKKYINI